MPKFSSFWIHCYIQYMQFFGLYQYMHGPCVYFSMCSHIFLFYEVKCTKQMQSHSDIWFPLRSNYADMEFLLLLLETEEFSPVVSDFWFLLYDSCSNSLQEAPNHVPINYLIIFTFIYIYAFTRRFYPKRLTEHSGYTFFCQCTKNYVVSNNDFY